MSKVGRIVRRYLSRQPSLHALPLMGMAVVSAELGCVQPVVSCITSGTEEKRSVGLVIEHQSGIHVELTVHDLLGLREDLDEAAEWVEGPGDDT